VVGVDVVVVVAGDVVDVELVVDVIVVFGNFVVVAVLDIVLSFCKLGRIRVNNIGRKIAEITNIMNVI